jgi:hypothetical protein
MKKLEAREIIKRKKTVTIEEKTENIPTTTTIEKTIGVVNAFSPSENATTRDRAMTLDTLSREVGSFLKIFH